ncbi:PilZ domain-containing protein [Peribacillus sp. SI8-4]|uniref:PilZ domain-containing protein n=1 Tax=Peribacillus sp. SI8-4 TaxID=3048009 RepID=UPI002553F3A1|nr:PilZ domain-containing protein [Peribacillus sp. SI8-4]
MKYNRNEAFRFSFSPPLPGFFSITKVANLEHESRIGPMSVLDISPRGVKFQTPLNLHEDADFELMLTLKLNDHHLGLRGKILWKQQGPSSFVYGFSMNAEEELEEIIVQELKAYRKEHE